MANAIYTIYLVIALLTLRNVHKIWHFWEGQQNRFNICSYTKSSQILWTIVGVSNANRQINSVNGIGHLMNLIGLDPNMA